MGSKLVYITEQAFLLSLVSSLFFCIQVQIFPVFQYSSLQVFQFRKQQQSTFQISSEVLTSGREGILTSSSTAFDFSTSYQVQCNQIDNSLPIDLTVIQTSVPRSVTFKLQSKQSITLSKQHKKHTQTSKLSTQFSPYLFFPSPHLDKTPS